MGLAVGLEFLRRVLRALGASEGGPALSLCSGTASSGERLLPPPGGLRGAIGAQLGGRSV